MKTVQEIETQPQAMVLPSLHRVPPVAKACRIGLVPVTCNCPLHHTSHVPCLACFFLGGCAWKMAGAAGCLPKLFSLENFNQAVECNFIVTSMMWFQISKSAENYRSIEDQIGWYNQNIAERLITFSRSGKLSNILEYTWMDLMHHDTSIHQISSFHPFHQHSNRMRRSLPTSRHEREQSACFVTSPSAFGACESFWRTKGLRLDEFCIQCFGEV